MKLIVDILMFILMLLEFSRGYMKPIFHEILGISLIVLLIMHLILNKNYIKNIFKGKYNFKRITILIINSLFMTTLLLSIIFGILSSQDLLTFLNVGSLTLIKLHKIFAYISLIFLGLHLGINLNKIISFKSKTLSILIIIYGVYSFIKLDIFNHLIGKYGFSMLTDSIILNTIRYLSVILMITIITNYIYQFIKKGRLNVSK